MVILTRSSQSFSYGRRSHCFEATDFDGCFVSLKRAGGWPILAAGVYPNRVGQGWHCSPGAHEIL